MKRLILSLFFIFSLSGISQTTVFNEGWDTQPQKLITATAKTAIVFETNTMGIGRYGKLLKYKVVGDEYAMVGELGMPETLIDFRFDGNQRLQVIGLQADHCDYHDSTNFWVNTIDTSSFTVDTARQMVQIAGFSRVAFANDSALILADGSGSKLYSLISNQIIKQGLQTRANYGDFVKGLFDGKFILSHSNWMGLFIENTNKHFTSTHIGYLAQKPKEVLSYGTDSLLIVTDSAIYKTDTNIYSFKKISIPFHQSNKIIANKLYIINGSVSYTFSLPSVSLLSTDSLKGLASKFKLIDVYPNNQILSLVALSEKSSALNEMVVKADISSQNETERSEVSVLGISPLDTTSIATSGGWNYYEVLFRIHCKNDGTDTIKNLQCLYSNYPYGSICGPLLNDPKLVNIASGDTGSFDQIVRIEVSKANVCFSVSVPNSNLEDNLNDNKSCMSFTISLEELSRELSFDIFPNPTTGLLHIEGDLKEPGEINVFGMDGRKIHVPAINISENRISLDFSNLTSGVYFFNMWLDDQLITRKVIKN